MSLKEKFWVRKKGSIMALLAEGYSEHQVASIFKISKTAVHKKNFKLQTLATDRHMTAKSFECHSRTVGRHQVTYKRMINGWGEVHGKWRLETGFYRAGQN